MNQEMRIVESAKTLYIIAGANGSGKSTLATKLLPAKNLSTFINADEIARELSPEDLTAVRVAAGKKALQTLASLIANGESFAIESTLSGNTLVKTIRQAKERGYQIVLIYAFLPTPQMCIDRIRVRVKRGGHFVPDEDVIRRYARSIQHFWHRYKALADQWDLYYNGRLSDCGDACYVCVARSREDRIDILDKDLYDLFLQMVMK